MVGIDSLEKQEGAVPKKEAMDKKEKNYRFFQEKLGELLKDPIYKRKFVIIHDEEVKGFFDTFSSALEEAMAGFPPEEFIIQEVIDEKERVGFLISAV